MMKPQHSPPFLFPRLRMIWQILVMLEGLRQHDCDVDAEGDILVSVMVVEPAE